MQRMQALGCAAERFRRDLIAMAWRDRALYALALTSFLGGFALQPVTGNRPDWSVMTGIGGTAMLVGVCVALIALPFRLVWLGAVARSRAPARDLARWATGFLRVQGLAANALHTFALFALFAAGFSVLKGAVAVASPFAWDEALARADRALHFGRYPHEWLAPLLARPEIVLALNFAYNAWFLVLVTSFIVAGFAIRRPDLRHRYLMGFMLVWLVGGFLMAMAISSAGPCFYARIGLGELYTPLMTQLHVAGASLPIWALATQDALWDGFTGVRPGSAGISAFPSMHVATATLFVLAARRIHPALFVLAAVFWALILLGSVVLAWHYAIDGYAGTLIAMLMWRLAGLYGRRLPGNAIADREPAPLL